MGIALIATGFTLWAMKSGSVVVLRTAAALSIFGMGHYYAACILGLTAFLLTFAIPKRSKILNTDSIDATMRSSL